MTVKPTPAPGLHHPLDDLNEAARADPDGFWRGVAAEHIGWFREPDRIYVADPPTFAWFVGGRMNLCWNALDRQVAAGLGGQPALNGQGEPGGRFVGLPAVPPRRARHRFGWPWRSATMR